MSQPAERLKIPSIQRRTLEEIAQSQDAPMQEVQRARALLLAADGASNVEIAQRCGVTPRTIAVWRGRFLDTGVEAVRWARRGRVTPDEIPAELVRYLMDDEAVPAESSRRVLQWRRRFPWLLSGPVSVAGVYMHPSQRAVAITASKAELRAARPAAMPYEPDRTGRVNALLPELAARSGTMLVKGICNGHKDYLSFLKLLDWRVSRSDEVFLVLNRNTAHIDHYEVDRWLSHPKRKRFHVQVITSPVLWHNLVAGWLREAAISKR